ncbi:MAG: hypothetical protein HRT89_11025 [Lentisphaeria bacterium]|nr:hypothetical protein [Lentisphaeria bacterium]NQZ68587.1 hypothetical protein [Lentisphaeria bacterium]
MELYLAFKDLQKLATALRKDDFAISNIDYVDPHLVLSCRIDAGVIHEKARNSMILLHLRCGLSIDQGLVLELEDMVLEKSPVSFLLNPILKTSLAKRQLFKQIKPISEKGIYVDADKQSVKVDFTKLIQSEDGMPVDSVELTQLLLHEGGIKLSFDLA